MRPGSIQGSAVVLVRIVVVLLVFDVRSAALSPSITTRRMIALRGNGVGGTTHRLATRQPSCTFSFSQSNRQLRLLRRALAGSAANPATANPRSTTKRPPDPHSLLAPDQIREQAEKVVRWMSTKESILALTGAGISTESGVPDYRGHNGAYHRHGAGSHRPVLHADFVRCAEVRKRYWARGMLGYRFFRNREPNRGHVAAASLERMGILGVHFPDSTDFYDDNDVQREGSAATRSIAVVTQNVDSLHQRAGSRRVLELHGRADVVRCGRCGAASSRNEFHDDLERVNADWLASALRQIEAEEAVEKDQNAEPQRDGSALRPDGDAHLRDADYSHLYIPSCDRCGVGFLKPDVVFFGDSVPRQRVAMCSAAVEACDGLLVAGTSLAVQSAYRHVRTASHRGVPICILNVGETRAEVDGLPGILKVEAPIGLTLAGVAAYYESQAKTVAS